MRVVKEIYGRHTDGSWADWICSTKPMSRTSGRATIHSLLSCSSAWVRIWLSGDDRPWSRLARAAWTSGGRTDILNDGKSFCFSIFVAPMLFEAGLARWSTRGGGFGDVEPRSRVQHPCSIGLAHRMNEDKSDQIKINDFCNNTVVRCTLYILQRCLRSSGGIECLCVYVVPFYFFLEKRKFWAWSHQANALWTVDAPPRIKDGYLEVEYL